MTLWRGGLRPFLQRRGILDEKANPLKGWYDPGFVKRTNLTNRIRGMADDLGFRLPSASLGYSLLRQTMRIFALERSLSNYHVDVRYPFLDRRLFEFALAIPFDQKVRSQETRSVVRRALKGMIPEEIRLRTTKAGPDEAFYRAIAREWPTLSRMCRDLRAADYGFVDAQRFTEALGRARHGETKSTVLLAATIALEFWLRSLETKIFSEKAPQFEVAV